MGLVSNLSGVVLWRWVTYVLSALLLAALLLAGWNGWWKNHYYDQLQNERTANAQAVKKTEDKLKKDAKAATDALLDRSNTREKELQRQLDEIANRPPAERVEYRLRDRWLPVSCPAGASAGAEPAQVGGLHPADEQFLVRLAFDASTNTDERNTLIDLYNQNREAVIEHNAKVKQPR